MAVVLLIAWLGLSQELAAAASTLATPTATYTYESHHRPADSAHGTAECGPPSACGQVVLRTPSTMGAYGTLVGHESPPAYGYYARTKLAQIDGAAIATRAELGTRASADLREAADASVAAETAALTEREIGTAVDDVLEGASFYKQSQATQYLKPGGFGQANADFDALTQGVTVIERGGGLRTATLSNGTKINVRPFSSGKYPTLEIDTPGNPALKIRY